VKDLGLVGLAPDLPDINGILRLTFSNGMTGLNQYPWRKKGYRTHSEEFQDHLSWFKGRHNLKFGFKLSGTNGTISEPATTFSAKSVHQSLHGQSLCGLPAGYPDHGSPGVPPVEVARNRWSYDFFATDDFKVSPKLTLNLGVRYELHLNWKENQGLMSLFDIASASWSSRIAPCPE